MSIRRAKRTVTRRLARSSSKPYSGLRTPPPARQPIPSHAKLEAWCEEGIASATDGCPVEPDGACQHGAQSWLVELGLI